MRARSYGNVCVDTSECEDRFGDVGNKLAVADIEACQTHPPLLDPLSDSSFMGLICATASRSLQGAGRH